jgi:maleate isomerase
MKGWRARLGFLVLPGNPTVEAELPGMAPPGVSVHFSRMDSSGATGTPGAAEGMEARVLACLQNIDTSIDLLSMVRPRVIAMACTAATYLVGPDREADLVRRSTARTGIPLITAFGSVLAALDVLGVRKVALGTPYPERLTQQARSALVQAGYDVVHCGRLPGVSNVFDETAERAYQLARLVDRDDAQAIFLGGVAMPTVEVLDLLERDLGKPVLSAASCLMWNALRTAGVSTSLRGYGRLFG